MAERGLGVGRRAGRTPHRQLVKRGEQYEEFNRRYEAVMKYYGVKPRRTDPASANENGDVEQSHHRFKKAVDQALMLRGSRDFSSEAEYAEFLKKLIAQRNAGARIWSFCKLNISATPFRRLRAAD